MFFHSIKIKITIYLSFILITGMILITILMIFLEQQDRITSYLYKEQLLSYLIKLKLTGTKTNNSNIIFDINEITDKISNSGIISLLIINKKQQQIYYSTDNNLNDLNNEIQKTAKLSLIKNKKKHRFIGSFWGILWNQRRYILISSPVLLNNSVSYSYCATLNFDYNYQSFKKKHKFIFFYIIFNTFILTLLSIFLINRIAIKPIKTLSKQALEFNSQNTSDFFVNKNNNEFSELNRSLNNMLKRISKDKTEIQKSFYSLKKKNKQLKKAHQDIIKAEKLASLGRLAAGIAHEIGNPIGIILGYIEILTHGKTPEDKRNEILLRCNNEVNRIDKIVKQLLNLAKPSSNEKPIRIQVHEVINNVIDMLDVLSVKPNLKISFLPGAAKDLIKADPDKLKQVFLNLLLNSIDAISSNKNIKNGEITIKTCLIRIKKNDLHKNIKITIIDNGSGISELDSNNIFDPFFTTKEPGKGTGLGLSVCFMIIEQIGGTIHADTKSSNGTEMVICLPLTNH